MPRGDRLEIAEPLLQGERAGEHLPGAAEIAPREQHRRDAVQREAQRLRVRALDGAGVSPARLRDAMEAHDRERIVQALEQCMGNQTRAAALLGISRRTLVERIRVYGLPRPRKA